MSLADKYNLGLTGRIVEASLTSKLPVIFIILALLCGVTALLFTPREEDPQIVVPMIDVIIDFPGASAKEVENLVTINLERRLWEIDGVEYVYSESQEGSAVVTARFYVGQDRVASLEKTQSKIMSYIDKVPPGVKGWIVKPREIDDVPIVTLTLYSADYSDYQLKRVAQEIVHRVQSIAEAGRAYIVGGRNRQIRALLNPDMMAARHVTALDISRALKSSDVNVRAGSMDVKNHNILVDAGPFIKSVQEVKDVVVGVYKGNTVHLSDVAQVIDGPEVVQSYTRLTFGPAAAKKGSDRGSALGRPGKSYPQVTVAVAKRRGSNAVAVADEILRRLDTLRNDVIPADMNVLVTRNYGKTANDKVNELIQHLGIAVISIVALLTLALGWREATITALAVPITLAVTLLANMLVGYSINRVTLFALILSLGLLVDDPIVDVENIHRHFRLRTHPPLDATILAVHEVMPPTIMATLAVIVSFLPLFFITGMMGPYMRPLAFNVPVAVTVSLIVAFVITPWITFRALRRTREKPGEPYDLRSGSVYKTYERLITPFLESRKKSYAFLGGIVLALVGCVCLLLFNAIPLKMLPFDNKNDFLIVLRTPEGTTLETTSACAADLAEYLTTVNEVTNVESYVGIPAPIDFNGLVRHYYLLKGDNQAQIRVNLVDKKDRVYQSHAVALRLRPDIVRIGHSYGAIVKIVEVPPGPPVLSTLVAEVYPPPEASYADLIKQAQKVKKMMQHTNLVVDADDSVEAPQTKLLFAVDREKAGLGGVTEADIAESAKILLGGESPATVHIDGERTPLEINIRLPRSMRSRLEDMGPIRLKSSSGSLVPFNELGQIERGVIDQTIYRKDLERVVFVTADMAGRSPVNAIFDLMAELKKNPLPHGYKVNLAGEGEWKITLDVFRDLGLGFLAALVLIYILLVQQTQSFGIPLVIMAAIPLTMIGIGPGFALLNVLAAQKVGNYPDPIFFTATAMIGMIALAGIVVRNSILLIDFIHVRTRVGTPLKQAIVESGAIRLRPIVLTAGAAVFGAWVITLDPVFSGLAWSFIFGIFASTAFTLLVVPMIYYLMYVRKEQVRE